LCLILFLTAGSRPDFLHECRPFLLVFGITLSYRFSWPLRAMKSFACKVANSDAIITVLQARKILLL